MDGRGAYADAAGGLEPCRSVPAALLGLPVVPVDVPLGSDALAPVRHLSSRSCFRPARNGSDLVSLRCREQAREQKRKHTHTRSSIPYLKRPVSPTQRCRDDQFVLHRNPPRGLLSHERAQIPRVPLFEETCPPTHTPVDGSGRLPAVVAAARGPRGGLVRKRSKQAQALLRPINQNILFYCCLLIIN
jgi:hypothetical protein